MFALYQCEFSSAREDNIPVPVNGEVSDHADVHTSWVKGQVWHDETSVFKRPTDLPLFVRGQPDELISRGIFWYLELQVSLLWQHQPPKNNNLLILNLYIRPLLAQQRCLRGTQWEWNVLLMRLFKKKGQKTSSCFLLIQQQNIRASRRNGYLHLRIESSQKQSLWSHDADKNTRL